MSALRAAMAEFSALERELAEERHLNSELSRRIEAAARRAEQEEARVRTLLDSLRQLHRALYSGTTAEHILRASLDVTQAERGYFVSQQGDGLVVRAVVGGGSGAGGSPTPFVETVVRRVLETGEPLRWRAGEPPAGVAAPDDESAGAGIAVPVSTLGTPSGVIVALDEDGEFGDAELQSLLAVGAQAGVASENARLRDEIQRGYVATIAVLADAVQAKDPYTHGHCEQVSRYARAAGRRLGLAEDALRVTCYAALLHDVGKIGVSDGVLNKPGPLLAEERKLVEAHVRIGHDLINSIPALQEIAAAILYHHEWFDGTGYPEGLAGERIPMPSRIVAAVDAYCAMIDLRSYKEPYSREHARAELERCAGTQFDPTVVVAVLAAIDEVDREMAGGTPWDASCEMFTPPLASGTPLPVS